MREAIKEQQTALRASISASSSLLSDEDQKRLKKEAADAGDAATKRLDEALRKRKGGDAKPEEKPAEPPKTAQTQSGNEITVEGQRWRYKGSGDRDAQENWEQVQ